jgi:hypothetical protein
MHTLRSPPTPDDLSWRFDHIPGSLLAPGSTKNPYLGKFISFTSEAIILRRQSLTVNRVLAGDDPAMFVAASFEGLRSSEFTGKITMEYMVRLFKEGLWLNGVQYRFYGHSNSQLVSGFWSGDLNALVDGPLHSEAEAATCAEQIAISNLIKGSTRWES